MLTSAIRPLGEATIEVRLHLTLLLSQANSPTTTLFQLDLLREELTYWLGAEFVCPACEDYLLTITQRISRLVLPPACREAFSSCFLTLDCKPPHPLPHHNPCYAIRLQPLACDERGRFTAYLGFIAPSSYPQGRGTVRLHQLGSASFWTASELGARWQEHSIPKLTPRERYLLALIQQGLQEKQIAEYLSITKVSVKKQKARLCEKLEVKNSQTALLRFSREQLFLLERY